VAYIIISIAQKNKAKQNISSLPSELLPGLAGASLEAIAQGVR
jgi:hypothetical protein